MNPLFARFLRSVYRKEPISGFILILGATDALIGGFGGKSSLLSIGLFIALLGIIMRWRQSSKKTPVKPSKPARYLLPPSSSREPLPLLVNNSKRQK
ncbi:hypothetical protein NIES4102_36840 [Chondrocystis sp. NIES-4102]|nr:hypothetical protein NIES4102_36840 [Chondrocystis sp. NIES-4102]